MLLNIIVIVLRETLEASILISVLLSVSKSEHIRFLWLPVALVSGLVGSIIYGSSLGIISEWFDYAGQEVVNVSLQLFIYACLFLLIPLHWAGRSKSIPLHLLMGVIVFVAIVREGGELFVFYSGFLQKEGMLLSAMTSGFVGLAIGLSAGVIIYYMLVMGGLPYTRAVHAIVLSLIAAGMVIQAIRLLEQADFLSSGTPLWDSNWLLPESSVAGQIVYAIFGYEATPSIVEIGAYLLALVGLAIAVILINRCNTEPKIISKST